MLIFFLACSNDDTSEETALDDQAFLGEIEWIQNFGGSGAEKATSVIPTSDGGFAVAGYTKSTDGDLSSKTLPVNDYWLLKFNGQGEIEWHKTFGGSKDDRGQAVIQTSDGGFAMAGYAMSSDGDGSNNEGFHDHWIIKLSPSGDLEWEQSFGFAGHDHAYDLVQTDDGGFFFSGFLDIVASGGAGSTEKGRSLTAHGVGEFWGTKIDSQGNIEWRKFFGGTNNDRSYGLVKSNEGGFIMTGFSESDDTDISNTKGSYDFWLVKVDSEGEFLWERSFGGSGIEVSYDIEHTDDGAYVVVGHSFSTDKDVSMNHGESDVWLIKVSDNGELLWERTYGGSAFDSANSVKLCSDGGFLIAGNSRSNDQDLDSNMGENDMWMLKTDPNGNLEWQMSLGGSGIDMAFDALEHDTDSYILVGESGSPDFNAEEHKGATDLSIIKFR